MVFEPIGNTLDAVGAAQVRSRAKKTPEEKKEAKEQKDALWGECKGFGQIWLYSLFLHFLLLFYFREFQYFAYISLTTCPNAVILVQPQSPILSAHFIFLSVT